MYVMYVADVEPTDDVKLVLELFKLHSVTTIIAIAFVAICVGVSFLRPWDMYKAWNERRHDEKLDAAAEAVEELTENLSLLRAALDVTRDSVERANRLRYGGSADDLHRGVVHLCDWTQRLFGFLEADINKVTLWVPSADHLIVATYNGMRPESAAAVQLPVEAPAGKLQPFAVVAFKSRQVQICSDRDTDPRYVPLNQRSSHPYKSIIAVPIIVGEECVGVLTIDSLRTGAFDDEDAKQLAQLCSSLIGLYLAPHDADMERWIGLQYAPVEG